ncbi:MAG: hypothetical protein MUC78_00420 [Bacteroidales bacterium]|jgi:hypothetical protein|nr:hypothetical protein [Bacteroidales bacterium]
MKKYFKITILVLLVVAAGLFWWRHYFVFGEGVKAGDLNYLVRKGYIFKTWEGKLIQTGFKTTTPGAMQSNEFEFSLTNDSLATVLERASGKFVELRYKEYIRPLPWRGMSKFVVNEILEIKELNPATGLPYY